MLFGITLYPMGNDSLARPVADFIDDLEVADLPHRVTAMETVVEGGWDQVMPVVRGAYERLLESHDRVFLEIRVDEHRGIEDRLQEAVEDVERELGHEIPR
jgi:uncharacterized protein YqgV (UPF0045/DUF77 family)